ncbi:MAG: DUF6600 domain-containing protein [Betaproteobacteria bacterium]
MKMHLGQNRLFALVLGVTLLALASSVRADPPTRVARLGYTDGAVSFSPAGENEWVRAAINRPLTTGDQLWADTGARAELQVGSAVIRMGSATSVTVLNLDDSVVQLQLAQGTLNLRVRRLGPNDVLEIDTPNLAFSIRQPGEYRIDVDAGGNGTTVATRRGSADVYGEGASYVIEAQRSYRFGGTGLAEYEPLALSSPDDFDRWGNERDRRWEGSVAARYVSADVIGYQDLDDNGTWRNDATYGNVWVPNRVAAGWAPYHDGHWAWIDPWGWTWVDDAPWGFAVSHYGRWTDLGGTWGWVPGPVRARAVYAPALVAFVGGRNFQLTVSSGNVGGVAWFPLGPRDVYRPTYTASRGYFTNINASNTVINNTQITNVYNNTNVTNVTYVNQRVPGAVVAVPVTAFVQSQPVSAVSIRMSQLTATSAPVTSAAAVAPVRASLVGAGARAGTRPPADAMERPVVAKRAPPATPVAFASRERQLAANPGKPLDATELKALKPIAPVAAPKIQVIAPTQAAAPIAAPPEQRGKSEHPGKSEQRGKPVEPAAAKTVPAAAPAAAAPANVAPPVAAQPVATPSEQRGKSEQRNKPADAPAPKAPPPASVAVPQVATPPVPTQPVAVPVDQRGKSEQRNRPADAPAPKASPPMPPVAAPQVATPPVPTQPVAAPVDQRGKSEQRNKPAEIPAAKAPSPPAPPPAAKAPSPPAPPPAAKAPPPPAPAAVPAEHAGKEEPRGKGNKPDGAKGGNKKSDEQLKQEEEEKKRKQ